MISDKAKNKLLKHHGLDAENDTDKDVDAAIKNSYSADEIEDMENRADRADEAEQALAEQKVEADLVKYANRIGKDPKNIDRWKAALISNRDMAVEMLEAIPEPTGTETRQRKDPLHLPNRAGNPDPLETSNAAADMAKTKESALIKNRAEKLEKEGMPTQMAWIRASEEIPIEIKAGLHK